LYSLEVKHTVAFEDFLTSDDFKGKDHLDAHELWEKKRAVPFILIEMVVDDSTDSHKVVTQMDTLEGKRAAAEKKKELLAKARKDRKSAKHPAKPPSTTESNLVDDGA
jgi:hypothetical protein